MLHSLAWKYQQGINFADPYMSWTLMIHKLLCLFSLLILTTILQGKWFYYSVTQKGNSALHDYATCPRSHSSKCQSWNLNPDLYDFKDPSTSALLSPKPTENFFFSHKLSNMHSCDLYSNGTHKKYFYIAHSFFPLIYQRTECQI